MVRHGNGVCQRNQKCEKNANAKGKSQHHKNSAHTSRERSQKTPPIEMRMKIKDAHSAAKLPPAVFAGKKNGRANQNEDETDARPQKQETGFAIFSQKFQHACDAGRVEARNQLAMKSSVIPSENTSPARTAESLSELLDGAAGLFGSALLGSK